MKMMNHLLRRRFVNIVTENYKSAMCSLHRVDVSEHLFYPSTATAGAEAAKAAAAMPSLGSLPEPTLSFQPEPRLFKMEQLFALVSPRSSESKILWSSPEGTTIVFDADTRCSHAMPSMAYKGCLPVAISVPIRRRRRRGPGAGTEEVEEEDLYVMNSITSYPSFQVLSYGGGGGRAYSTSPWRRSPRDPWKWETLPPPPLPDSFFIKSHALLDDGVTICVTAFYVGPADEKHDNLTFLFDTVKREWYQSNWHLPFFRGAEYVPDHKLWLGFCHKKQQLCTYDLAAAAAGETPKLKRLGEVVLMPKEWDSIEPRLINLGDGRFCLAKIMQAHKEEDVYEEEEEEEEEEDDDDDGDDGDDDDDGCSHLSLLSSRGRMVALLTGVEMLRGEEGFKMVVHKSLSYILDEDRIKCVI